MISMLDTVWFIIIATKKNFKIKKKGKVLLRLMMKIKQKYINIYRHNNLKYLNCNIRLYDIITKKSKNLFKFFFII